jgi:Transposase DDE domain group 1
LVIDVDSFVGEVYGRLKQGAAYGYTKVLGYHPLLATRADTREVLHIRLRKGSANTQKGMLRFCDELIARVTRAGATGTKLLRADSGFGNIKVFKRLEQAGWQYSIGVRMQKGIRQAVDAIDERAWQAIEDYPEEGEAQIAETTYGGRRLIVRRTRLVGPQAQLWPDWRHFAFITNRTGDITIVESEHRDHAVVEQVIVDLKDQCAGALPLRRVQRQRRVDRARRARAQPAPLDTTDRPSEQHSSRRPHATPPADHDRRTPDPPRPLLDLASPRPLALAGRLPHRARPDPRAPRRLTATGHAHEDQQVARPAGAITAAREHPKTSPRKRPSGGSTPDRPTPQAPTRHHPPGQRLSRPLTQRFGGSGLRQPGCHDETRSCGS